jgi:hypothetical protein
MSPTLLASLLDYAQQAAATSAHKASVLLLSSSPPPARDHELVFETTSLQSDEERLSTLQLEERYIRIELARQTRAAEEEDKDGSEGEQEDFYGSSDESNDPGDTYDDDDDGYDVYN